MEKSIKKGKLFIYAVIFSCIFFIILHNNERYFVGDAALLPNLIRIGIFAPLLFFLYKKYNWARHTLAVLSTVLVLVGIIGIPVFARDWIKQSDLIYLGSMMVCMLFNAVVLFFSKDIISYVRSR